jgi:hypothetical protein
VRPEPAIHVRPELERQEVGKPSVVEARVGLRELACEVPAGGGELPAEIERERALAELRRVEEAREEREDEERETQEREKTVPPWVGVQESQSGPREYRRGHQGGERIGDGPVDLFAIESRGDESHPVDDDGDQRRHQEKPEPRRVEDSGSGDREQRGDEEIARGPSRDLPRRAGIAEELRDPTLQRISIWDAGSNPRFL